MACVTELYFELACRLDSLANQNAITELFLQAIDACPEELQKDILSILSELVGEDEHEVGCIFVERFLDFDG